MTYNIDYFNLLQKTSNPSTQAVSTTYSEVGGSKGNLVFTKSTSTFLYKFSFYAESKSYMHIKLQKSNDNFSSNIEDVPDCNINFSSDTIQTSDHYYKVCNVMFIVENLNSAYAHLRLVTRAYSSSWNSNLHTTNYFDGGSVNISYEPILSIIEI